MNIKKEILKTYNRISKEYDKEFCQNIYFLTDLNFFLKKLPKKANILDVGCGTGHVASYLEKQGFLVTGIDFSNKMIEIAKRRCKKSKFIKADIEQFDYGYKKYDGIIALSILIHFRSSNIKKLLKKFHKSLQKDGLLFISMIKGRGEYLGPEPLDLKLKMYFKYTTKKEIQQLLAGAGFKEMKFKQRLLQTKHEKQVEFFIVARKNPLAGKRN